MQKEIPNILSTVNSTTEPTTTEPTEPVVDPVVAEPQTEDKKDPLDVIADPEELRREAKKYRGIASRKQPEAIEKPVNDSPYITREEIYENNRKQALDELSNISENDPLADIKREIDENWADIISYYTPRNGQKTADDILEDIYDAHLVWKRRVGNTSTDDSARNLQATVVTQPVGGVKSDTKKTNSFDERFKKGTPTSEWYKKKD